MTVVAEPLDPQWLAQVQAATGGRYLVLQPLGRGGMAVVLLAHDVALNRKVALKVAITWAADPADTLERFRREARLAASLEHPHIVPVHAVGDADGLGWFAMQYIDGRTLDQVVRDDVRLPAEQIRRVLQQVSDALAYAHARGVVHRDIKPGNIMLDTAGRTFVTDFGIARSADVPGLTTTGRIIGTPLYMSPEQFRGQPLTGAVDQYALGCVAFQLLTGRVPFPGPDVAEVLRGHLMDPVPDLRSLAPDVPADLEAIVRRLLAKRPEDRFADMAALRDALDETTASPPARRSRHLALAASVVLIVGAAALGRNMAITTGGPPTNAAEDVRPANDASTDLSTEPRATEQRPVRADTASSTAAPLREPIATGSTSDARSPAVGDPADAPSNSAQPSAIVVGSRLRGSLLYVNERLVLSLPNTSLHTIAVPAGRHVVSVRLDECVPFDTVLTVAPGDTIQLNRRTPRCT